MPPPPPPSTLRMSPFWNSLSKYNVARESFRKFTQQQSTHSSGTGITGIWGQTATNKKSKRSEVSHSSVKLETKKNSPLNTNQIQISRTEHCTRSFWCIGVYSNHITFKLHCTRINRLTKNKQQSAVQSRQSRNKTVDPKRLYSHAKFERPH